jgi:hypothetical protein
MSNPKTLKPFPKGVSGNPDGRPKDPAELKALKKLTKGQLELLVYKILNSTPEELKGFNKTVIELWLSSGAAKAIQAGDYNRLMQLLDRVHGKVKEQVEISTPKPTIIRLRSGESLVMGAEIEDDED